MHMLCMYVAIKVLGRLPIKFGAESGSEDNVTMSIDCYKILLCYTAPVLKCCHERSNDHIM